MDFNPVEGMSRLPRSSSSSSSGSSSPSNRTDMKFCRVVSKPHFQEDKKEPLPNYRGCWDKLNWIKNDAVNIDDTTNGEVSPMIGHGASIKREEFSFWTNTFSNLVGALKNRDLSWQLHTLVTQTLKDGLPIHNYQRKLGAVYPYTALNTFSVGILSVGDDVAGPKLEVAQRLLRKVTISLTEEDSRIKNMEAKFLKVNGVVNRWIGQLLQRQQRAVWLKSFNNLYGASKDYIGLKACCLDSNEHVALVTAEIRRFSIIVEELEEDNLLSEDLVRDSRILLVQMHTKLQMDFSRVRYIRGSCNL